MKPAWATEWIIGQSVLHCEIVSSNNNSNIHTHHKTSFKLTTTTISRYSVLTVRAISYQLIGRDVVGNQNKIFQLFSQWAMKHPEVEYI